MLKKLDASIRSGWERYCRYLHRKNAELREQLKNEQEIQRVCVASGEYWDYTGVVADTINNAAEILHLVPVKHYTQIHYLKWLHKYHCGVWTLRYRCRYHSGYGLSRDDFRRIMQQEICQVCNDWQIPWLGVEVRLFANHTALIEIVPYDVLVYYKRLYYSRKRRKK